MDLPQVKCPHCGAMNPEDSFFCSECGGQTRSLITDTGKTIEPEPQPVPPAGPPAASPAPPPPPAPPRPLDVNAPGAGLAPPPDAPAATPPPPAAYPGPEPQPQQYQQPYAPPAGPNQGQGGGYPPAQPYGGGYGGYGGYGLPADGNTSGMGANYPAPPDASGWTFAGFIPWGLFGFFNGSVLWGVIGLLGGLFGGIPGLVYMIYMGVQGRELAWRNRRFTSVMEYADTMAAWNRWGLIVLIASLVLGVIGFILYISLFAYLFATEGFI